MACYDLDFTIDSYDQVRFTVNRSTRLQYVEKITTMYEDYCRTSGIHAKLDIRFMPQIWSRKDQKECLQYKALLEIDDVTGTKAISNFVPDIIVKGYYKDYFNSLSNYNLLSYFMITDDALNFSVVSIDKFRVDVQRSTMLQCVDKITTMYEYYCRTSGIHVQLDINLLPWETSWEYERESNRYKRLLGIDEVFGTKAILNFVPDTAK